MTINDFSTMASELSQRDVRIVKMEMERDFITLREELSEKTRMAEALQEENRLLREKVSLLETDFENLRFQNHWMRQFILLSVERVRNFFAHMQDYRLMSAVKAFVLDMLPPNATAEQVAFANEVMQLPEPEDEAKIVVNGNYNDIHDNEKLRIDN